MNSFNYDINNIFKNVITEYIRKISENYPDTDIDELTEIWNSNCDLQLLIEAQETKKPATKSKPVKQSAAKPSSRTISRPEEKVSDTTTCAYIFSKGKKIGERCSSKPKAGSEFCSRSGHGDKETKPAKKVKQDKSETSSTTSSTDMKIKNRVLKMNKSIDKLWHEETGFVFESKDNKIVIGRCVNGVLNIVLSEEDRDLCKRFGFKLPVVEETDEDSEEFKDAEQEIEDSHPHKPHPTTSRKNHPEEEKVHPAKSVLTTRRLLDVKDAKKAKTLLGLRDKEIHQIVEEITGAEEEKSDEQLSEEEDDE